MRIRKYIKYITLPAAFALAIFIATCIVNSGNVPQLPEGVPWDKIVHFGMFLLLSGFSFWNYFKLHDGKPNRWRWIFWGFILPVLYGGAIEMMQKYFFSSRSAEWGDFIADILGSLTALVLALYWEKRLRK